jgi:hypothetical protein
MAVAETQLRIRLWIGQPDTIGRVGPEPVSAILAVNSRKVQAPHLYRWVLQSVRIADRPFNDRR